MKRKINWLALWSAITLACTLATSPDCAAGEGAVGNGGNGIRIGGKLYLLDLAEAGIQDQAYVPTEECRNQPELIARLGLRLDKAKFPLNLVAGKLCELRKADMGFGTSVLQAIEAYEWIVLGIPLRETDDADTDVSLVPGKRVQIAVRGENAIRVHGPSLSQLNPSNRAALVIHEAVYAMTSPEFFQVLEGGMYQSYYRQDSRLPRSLTGFLFSPALASKGRRGIIDIIVRNDGLMATLSEEPHELTRSPIRLDLAGYSSHGGGVRKRSIFAWDSVPDLTENEEIGDICEAAMETRGNNTPQRAVSLRAKTGMLSEASLHTFKRSRTRVGSWVESSYGYYDLPGSDPLLPWRLEPATLKECVERVTEEAYRVLRTAEAQ